MRADELPCYGYFRNTAPNLCRFADKNTTFLNAYSQSSHTLDSHMSLFTSLYPSTHQVLDGWKDSLSPRAITLAQMLKTSGYKTIYTGPLDDYNLPLAHGLGRGFDVVQSNLITDGWMRGYEMFRKSISEGRSTFLFLHTYSIHAPYLTGRKDKLLFASKNYSDIPLTDEDFRKFTSEFLRMLIDDFKIRLQTSDTPESLARNKKTYEEFLNAKSLEEAKVIFEALPDAGKFSYYIERYYQNIARDPGKTAFLRALYDEKIFQFDQELKSLFAILEDPSLARKTLVIITSDHGEEFMEHGELDHGGNIYNTSTHIPLVLSVPGIKPQRLEELAQSIDIYPTIAGLVGIRPPPFVQG
ncbi:MAG: sulfatase-like hydrolase/transferase, partial [Patescibacteria group bacterium]